MIYFKGSSDGWSSGFIQSSYWRIQCKTNAFWLDQSHSPRPTSIWFMGSPSRILLLTTSLALSAVAWLADEKQSLFSCPSFVETNYNRKEQRVKLNHRAGRNIQHGDKAPALPVIFCLLTSREKSPEVSQTDHLNPKTEHATRETHRMFCFARPLVTKECSSCGT